MLLNDLLTVLAPRIDHTRVVRIFQRSDNVPLINPYLIAVQGVSSMACFRVQVWIFMFPRSLISRQ